jgi:hypothetical protein
MRKRITPLQDPAKSEPNDCWLDLEQIATLELSSEDSPFPIESALRSGNGLGWRAAQVGEQQIRSIFDQPVSLRRIHLRFDEGERERTHGFTLTWRSAEGGPIEQIVRQQWNFSPNGSVTQIEDYAVNLASVSILELAIRPDISRRDVVASLTEWRMA